MKCLIQNLKENINLKNNKFLKLYLLILSLFNIAYLFTEIYKPILRKMFLLDGYLQHYELAKIFKVGKINNIIEYIIICINLFFLIRLIIKKTNPNVKQFLIINFTYSVIASLISYILSIIFSLPIGNLTQQLFATYEITFLVLIYYIIKTLCTKFKKSTENHSLS